MEDVKHPYKRTLNNSTNIAVVRASVVHCLLLHMHVLHDETLATYKTKTLVLHVLLIADSFEPMTS
jgi:hypothetical protein